jgi:FMN phosphatase YigB (HAD superfamily)
MKGAEETLRSLKDEGFVLYVASNGVLTIQEKRMDLAGLYPYFTGFFVSDVIGCNKPNPGFFEYILDRIGERDKSRILMTGDEVIADISGTLKIGLKACLFRKKTDTELERDFKNEYPDVPIIHSLAEIRRIAGEENQKG